MQYIAKISAIVVLYSIALMLLTSATTKKRKCVSSYCQVNGFHSTKCVYKK